MGKKDRRARPEEKRRCLATARATGVGQTR